MNLNEFLALVKKERALLAILKGPLPSRIRKVKQSMLDKTRRDLKEHFNLEPKLMVLYNEFVKLHNETT